LCVLRCGATIAVAFVIVGVAGDVIDENLFDSVLSLIGREKILLFQMGIIKILLRYVLVQLNNFKKVSLIF